MLEKQSLIVENTLKAEEAKVREFSTLKNIFAIECLSGERVQRDDGEALREVEKARV